MGITLTQLIKVLEEEGVVGEEAEEAVERFMKMREQKKAPLARRGSDGIDFPQSAQQVVRRGRQPVDYGDETPAEAERRWMQQEMDDPDGVFAGGQSAGGIFGDAPIATESYDPAARRRTLSMEEAKASVIEKRVTVQVLTKIAEKLGADVSDLEGILPGVGVRGALKGRGR